MPCPLCHDKGYVKVHYSEKGKEVSVSVECDHRIPDPACPNCLGDGYDGRDGIKVECGCKHKYNEHVTVAGRIVEDIIHDMTDRRGLRQEWEQIDDDIQQEIVAVWRAIVEKRLSEEK